MLTTDATLKDFMPAASTGAIGKSTKEFDKALGARVKFLRKLRGISQQALADEIGITFQQVQKYEHGSNRFPIARLLSTARILGCTAAFLLGEESSDDTSDLVSAVIARKDIAALLPDLMKASPDQVRALRALITADVR